jgi:hypothetical protein
VLRLVVGGVLGALVVAGAGLTQTSANRRPELAATVPGMEEVELPAGDYAAFCRALPQAAGEEAPDGSDGDGPERDGSDLQGLRDLYAAFDFTAVLAVAPEGLKPSLRTLRDQRPAVFAVLDDADQIEDIEVDDLPDGVVAAFATVVAAATEGCPEG